MTEIIVLLWVLYLAMPGVLHGKTRSPEGKLVVTSFWLLAFSTTAGRVLWLAFGLTAV